MKTFKTLFLYCALVCIFIQLELPNLFAASGENDGKIIETIDYVFPSYDDAVKNTDVEKYTSKEDFAVAVRDRNFKFQKLTYLSDNLKVKAYLYKPSSTGTKKYPTIIFNRGSYVRGDIAPELISMFHRLAKRGFVIIAPMLRQSDGGEGRDRLGGPDFNDLMNILPAAKSLKYVDPNNLFMYGESRGGMMTYKAMKMGFPINATAVFGAFTDMKAMVEFRPDVYTPQLGNAIWGDYEKRKEEIFHSRSAIKWFEDFKAPVLIMHGGNDSSVSPRQSMRLAIKLLESKKPYELIIYQGDNHILSENREDRDLRAVRWFQKHYKKR